MRKPQEYGHVARVVRKLARHELFNLALTNHAREKMRKDDLSIADVINILKGCCIIGSEGIGVNSRFTVQGKTTENQLTNIVIKIFESENKLLVITVYAIH